MIPIGVLHELYDKKKYICAFVLLAFLALIAWSYYDYYIRTLYFSEIVGTRKDTIGTIFVNLFDFDTGVTRYEFNNVIRKSFYWEKRQQQIDSIKNPQQRAKEHEKLVAEMMQDPATKKLVQKMWGFGVDGTLFMLKAFSIFHGFL